MTTYRRIEAADLSLFPFYSEIPSRSIVVRSPLPGEKGDFLLSHNVLFPALREKQALARIEEGSPILS